VSECFPSDCVIKLDCVIVEHIPALTILSSPKCLPGAFRPQKEASTDPAKMNNRTGVPSRGAEDIGRGSAIIKIPRRSRESAPMTFFLAATIRSIGRARLPFSYFGGLAAIEASIT
jgi:hypothetical protein